LCLGLNNEQTAVIGAALPGLAPLIDALRAGAIDGSDAEDVYYPLFVNKAGAPTASRPFVKVSSNYYNMMVPSTSSSYSINA
jgi:hypothetical protein